MGVSNAKEVSAQNDSLLVGTWINVENNEKIVFNSDGTGTGFGQNADKPFMYEVIGGKIAVVKKRDAYTATNVGDYVISSDGKTMIVSYGCDSADDGVLTKGCLLKKAE
jgi:hypothetical protein